MSWTDETTKALSVMGYALHALEAIGPIAKGILGDSGNVLTDKSLAKLSAISLAVDAIRKGLDGKIPVEAVQAEIDKLTTSHQHNIDQTQSEIDKKFPR